MLISNTQCQLPHALGHDNWISMSEEAILVFKTGVYFSKRLNRFLIVDCKRKPTSADWVVIQQSITGKIIIQRYKSQLNFGVVRILGKYKISELQKLTEVYVQ